MKRRTFMPLILTALAAALVYSLLHQTAPRKRPVTTSQETPQYALQDVELTRYGSNGEPRLRAHAVEVDQFPGGRITGTGLRVTTLHGDSAWTATAPHGQLGHRNQPLHLTGGVQAHGEWPDTGAPLTINTPQLWIDPRNHELHTSAKVQLASARRNGTATGLRANWLTQNLSLLANVHLDYDVPPPQ